MKIKRQTIHNHDSDVFDIKADLELYQLIVDDMIANAGKFAPRSVWQKLEDAGDYSTYESGASRYKEEVLSTEEMIESAQNVIAKYPCLSDLLDSWVGPRGKREEFDPEMVAAFREYSKAFASELFSAYQQADIYKTYVDITTISEVGIMNHLCTDKENIRILEVGGGYGRLCEGIMNVFGNQTTYLLADSVPVSIMYSYLFLRKTLPNKKIGLYYSSANVNIEDYDCYIVPTWRMEDICEKSKLNFDLLINIQSMQEMTQWHVDYYLDFFNRYARLDSFIYLNNNEEYIFKGDWNYPTNWRMLTRHQTPWSWSENCPTTIYQKKAKNMTVWNSLVSYEHQSNVNTRMSVKSQKRKIQEIYSSLTQTRQRVIALEENKKAMETEIEGLNSSLSKMREENKEQEIKIIKLEEINTVGVNTIKDLNMKQAKLMKSYSQLEEKIESQKKIEGQYKDQIKDLKKKEAQLAAVLNSTSWKITEPIRKIIDKIRLPKKH